MTIAGGVRVIAGPNEIAAERVARNMESWDSIELRVRVEGTLHEKVGDVEPGSGSETTYHYIETKQGRRFLAVQDREPDGSTALHEAYCDGARCANVIYDRRGGQRKQDHILIGREFMNEGQAGHTDRPVPLRYSYVGKIPLYEALPGAEFLGNERFLDRDCEQYLFRDVKWAMKRQHLVYTLDGRTSVPLKVQVYLDEASLQAGRLAWEWAAKSLDEVQGSYFPLKSHSSQFNQSEGDVLLSHEFEVEELRLNRDYPKSTFWPTFEPGVLVLDSITQKEYRVPGPEAPGPAGVADAASTAPIRATPPQGISAWIPTLMLGLGVAALVVGLALWWRNR